ncbi:MAG: hypothetical protein AB7T49_09795 [Oligoflexales bacterium]
MTHPRQIRLLTELRSFIQNLDPSKFESLSTGIGLGSLEPREVQPKLPTPPQMAAWKEEPEARVKTRPNATMTTDVRAARAWNARIFGIKTLAHVLDIMVVLSAILVGMIVVELLTQSGFSFSGKGLRNMAGAQFFRTLGALKTSIIVYTIFVVYFMVFRILAGVTIGENLVKSLRMPRPKKS